MIREQALGCPRLVTEQSLLLPTGNGLSLTGERMGGNLGMGGNLV